MLTIKNLKLLIEYLPDDAEVVAYEGEGTGLRVMYGGFYGWIETGCDDDTECNPGKHSVAELLEYVEKGVPGSAGRRR